MAEGNKVRILIVDDVAETRENIRKLLQFEKDFEVVGTAGSGKQGVEAAKELKPDVVLMDINMPDMDGITATELIRRNYPPTQIVILSVQSDSNYMRRAMLAGARDFLTKPPSVDELTNAVQRAGKMAHDEKAKAAATQQATAGAAGASGMAGASANGKVVVVYSPKGGAGTTTLAVNLALALHKEDSPVALVDANLQFGDVAVFLNEQVKNSVIDLSPRADELDSEVIDEVMISNKASGLKILAAPNRPEYAENVTGEQYGKVLQYLRRLFSYVVVDSSSILTDVVLAAMDVSDVIVLITTQEIPAIKDARLFLDLAGSLKIDRRRILFVMNRFDKRINISPDKVAESFKHEVVAVIPFDDKSVLLALNRGIPFILSNPSLPISKSVLGLEEIIRQRVSELSATDSDNGKSSSRR
jgi:pilus assembly protein CpaE